MLVPPDEVPVPLVPVPLVPVPLVPVPPFIPLEPLLPLMPPEPLVPLLPPVPLLPLDPPLLLPEPLEPELPEPEPLAPLEPPLEPLPLMPELPPDPLALLPRLPLLPDEALCFFDFFEDLWEPVLLLPLPVSWLVAWVPVALVWLLLLPDDWACAPGAPAIAASTEAPITALSSLFIVDLLRRLDCRRRRYGGTDFPGTTAALTAARMPTRKLMLRVRKLNNINDIK